MTLPRDLEVACGAILTVARANCCGCSAERLVAQLTAAGRHPFDLPDQAESHAIGCQAIIKAAADGMLATVDELHGRLYLNSWGIQKAMDVRATINRLKGERTERSGWMKAKDEAWKELTAAHDNYLHVAFDVAVGNEPYEALRIAEEDLQKARDAYAQAHTDAALADTLGLLEALAKAGTDPCWRGLTVHYLIEDDTFTYTTGPWSNVHPHTRDEAQAALLAGNGKE